MKGYNDNSRSARHACQTEEPPPAQVVKREKQGGRGFAPPTAISGEIGPAASSGVRFAPLVKNTHSCTRCQAQAWNLSYDLKWCSVGWVIEERRGDREENMLT